jgi:polyhydroxybutyrate depolymerase
MLHHVVVVAALLAGACNSASSNGTSDAAPAALTCSGKSTPSSDATWTITSSGTSRMVDVHVPPSYDPTRAMPVVFNIHGFTMGPAEEAQLTLMNAKADAEGVIVMYPYGTGFPLSFNGGACCGTAATTNVNDIQFVRDILTTASDKLCVDATRVYATGLSNGAFLSHRIGCELADLIAAIAPVAGVLLVPTCAPSRPVPVMEFHGTADEFDPWNGDAAIGVPSVPATFDGWATRNSCTGDPVQTYSHGDATCQTYQQCKGDADVTLCTITGGGHTWPGGTPVPVLGATSNDINATDAMWTFFAAHHL